MVACPWSSTPARRALSVGSIKAMTLLVVPRSMPTVLRIFMLPAARGGPRLPSYCCASGGDLPVQNHSGRHEDSSGRQRLLLDLAQPLPELFQDRQRARREVAGCVL